MRSFTAAPRRCCPPGPEGLANSPSFPPKLGSCDDRPVERRSIASAFPSLNSPRLAQYLPTTLNQAWALPQIQIVPSARKANEWLWPAERVGTGQPLAETLNDLDEESPASFVTVTVMTTKVPVGTQSGDVHATSLAEPVVTGLPRVPTLAAQLKRNWLVVASCAVT
jgi:hypothetical protein